MLKLMRSSALCGALGLVLATPEYSHAFSSSQAFGGVSALSDFGICKFLGEYVQRGRFAVIYLGEDPSRGIGDTGHFAGGSYWNRGPSTPGPAISASALSACVVGSTPEEFTIIAQNGADKPSVAEEDELSISFRFRGRTYSYAVLGITDTRTEFTESVTDFPVPDTTPPTITIGPLTPAGTGTYTAAITLSEAAGPGSAFEASDLVVSNGTATLSGSGTSFTATITPAPNARSVALAVPANAFQDAAGNASLAANAGSLAITPVAEKETAEAIGKAVENQARAILQHQPKFDRRIDRLNNRRAGGGDVALFGLTVANDVSPVDISADQNGGRFATSLNRTVITPTADVPGKGDFGVTRFDVWVEGVVGKQDFGSGKNNFGIVHTGADYLVTPDILLGVSTQLDWGDYKASGAAAKSDSFGFMVGPYATARLSEDLYLDARAAWGKAKHDVSPLGTYTDDVSSERVLLSAALIGDYDAGGFRIEPEVRVSYFSESTGAYTDSNGVAVAGYEVETGTLEFGPTLSRKLEVNDGLTLTPRIGMSGIWTFAQKNTAEVASGNGLGFADTGLRARMELGVSAELANNVLLSLDGTYDGIGDDNYEAWSGALKVSKSW